MGEETKQEQPPTPAPAPAVDDGNMPAEVIKEDKVDEAPKQEPIPPQPVVLYVDLHCVGCAKKIQRSIMKLRGVEEVVIDMGQNQVTIKGVVEPEAICNFIKKKTKRMANLLSPLPSPVPETVASQVSGLVTVELNVNMHCEACAQQLKKKILKMRGVQTAETEYATGNVKVTGTMDAEKLVEYLYRRTKKQARIVPQPEPEPENPPAEEKKEEVAPEESESPPPPPPAEEEANKEEVESNPPPPPLLPAIENGESKAMAALPMPMMMPAFMMEQEAMKRMMYQYYYQPMPMYMIDRTPAPQLFSDENPNACSIS